MVYLEKKKPFHFERLFKFLLPHTVYFHQFWETSFAYLLSLLDKRSTD
jgi:hypothetical protein